MARFDVRQSWFSPCALAALLGWAMFAASPAGAAINYGNFTGNTVDYLQVTEEANTVGDAPPLFGLPAVTGDSIDFDPVGFNAASAGGGADLTEGQLKFTVMAHPFSVISSLNIAEAGDVSLLGLGNDGTFGSVTTNVFIDISEVDFQPINVVSANNLSIPFAPSGGTFGLGTDGGGGPLFTANWAGSLFVDVDAILTANGVPFQFGATRVDVNLGNTLGALSQVGTQAVIAKKNANGIVITVNAPIPEPSSCMLAVVGVTGLLLRRRQG